MYKDKAKQREANRQASRRARIKRRTTTDLTPLVAQGMTNEGMTPQGMTDSYNEVQSMKHALNEAINPLPEHTAQGNIRVSKPGDSDYEPQCETTRAFEAGFDKIIRDVIAKPKRGKDIKCFADLPPDVQVTIDRLSLVEGKIDQTIKTNRTAIAVNYQHLFPDRYNRTGVA